MWGLDDMKLYQKKWSDIDFYPFLELNLSIIVGSGFFFNTLSVSPFKETVYNFCEFLRNYINWIHNLIT